MFICNPSHLRSLSFVYTLSLYMYRQIILTHTHTRIYISNWFFILCMRNWLMHKSFLQKLRNPTICCLQAGDPEEPVIQFQSKSKCWRTRGAKGINSSLCSNLGSRQEARGINSSFSQDWVMPTTLLYSTLLSSLIHMPVSSRNTPQTHPKLSHLGTSWGSQVTQKITIMSR